MQRKETCVFQNNITMYGREGSRTVVGQVIDEILKHKKDGGSGGCSYGPVDPTISPTQSFARN